MAEAMSETRLERLAGLAELPCSCGNADCGNYASALTAAEARELAAEAKRARATQPPLTDEYGMRITYVSTHTAEGAIADTLDGALEALAAFDALERKSVLSRKLRIRKVGQWQDLEEEGDRG